MATPILMVWFMLGFLLFFSPAHSNPVQCPVLDLVPSRCHQIYSDTEKFGQPVGRLKGNHL